MERISLGITTVTVSVKHAKGIVASHENPLLNVFQPGVKQELFLDWHILLKKKMDTV